MNICCLFAQKSVLYVGNVGYSHAVYPVLCELYSFTVLWSLYMFMYTTSELQDESELFIAVIAKMLTA